MWEFHTFSGVFTSSATPVRYCVIEAAIMNIMAINGKFIMSRVVIESLAKIVP